MLSFEMYDITNLANADDYHSARAEMIFLAENRVDLVDRGHAGARETRREFQLERRTR